MWGNKPGWFISVVIVGVMGWLIWSLGQPEGLTPPSGQFKNLAEPIHLPVAPDEAVPGVMTEERDAGDQYWTAINAYLANPKPYDAFTVKDIKQVSTLNALDTILNGASAKRATIFLGKPEMLVNFRPDTPELDALFRLGQLCNSIGHYYVISPKNANEAEAKRYLHAGFSLGAKMYAERLTHGEFIDGVKLMQGAADSLRELAKRKGDKAREAELKRFGDRTADYYKMNVQDLSQKVSSIYPAHIAQNAGDVFALARSNPDRMWKVEAVLKVGRYRYNAARRADQIAAGRIVAEDAAKYGYPDLNRSDDPAVRAAAKAARELTIEQYRMIR
jgi:hypothetical protein